MSAVIQESDSLHPLEVHVGSVTRQATVVTITTWRSWTSVQIIEALLHHLQLDSRFVNNYCLATSAGSVWLQPDDEDAQPQLKYLDPTDRLALNTPCSQSSCIYLVSKAVLLCLGTQEVASVGGSLVLHSADTDDSPTQVQSCRNVRFSFSPDITDDLVDVPVLNEKVLLQNLQKRFHEGKIYTYVGGILIAVNPFLSLNIYNPAVGARYRHHEYGKLPPHIFAVADTAYSNLMRTSKDQCIVISGESGSGKTESVKLVLHHLAMLSYSSSQSSIETALLASSPVLEAFGNARTFHNNNSSRFGKFIQICYDRKGSPRGAVLKKYLLEKSRIIAQAPEERNYHVFYYLLAGSSAEERRRLYLRDPSRYHYLRASTFEPIRGMDEAYEFKKLRKSMMDIGISLNLQNMLFAVLSATLLIGCLQFVPSIEVDGAVETKDNDLLNQISDLLQLDESTLVQSLVSQTKITRGEKFTVHFSQVEAQDNRDAMAKSLYGGLFEWIVRQINNRLWIGNNYSEENIKSLGILDIFGFEDFERNSFEQFCINFANESLQYYLNQHIFKLRQDEYVEEGIRWNMVEYVDNSSCLQLISGKPTGLTSLIDEESNLTIGTDESMLEKFNKHCGSHLCYDKASTKTPTFSIVHYAGTVKYHIKDFKAKNRDSIRPEIIKTLKNSRMTLVNELMGSNPAAVRHWSRLRTMLLVTARFRSTLRVAGNGRKLSSPSDQKVGIQARSRLSHYEDQNKDPPQRVGHNQRYTNIAHAKNPPSIISQFQSSLYDLMDILNQSHPFFVRCIRSNACKEALLFDPELVMRQLQYTGMLETVRVRQAGYPCRMTIQELVRNFAVIMPNGKDTSVEQIGNALVSLGLDPASFQIGKTKVFLRETPYEQLKHLVHDRIQNAAQVITRWYKTASAQKDYKKTVKAIFIIQRYTRRWQARRRRNTLKHQQNLTNSVLCHWQLYVFHRKCLKTPPGAASCIQNAYRRHRLRRDAGYPTPVSLATADTSTKTVDIIVEYDLVEAPRPQPNDDRPTATEFPSEVSTTISRSFDPDIADLTFIRNSRLRRSHPTKFISSFPSTNGMYEADTDISFKNSTRKKTRDLFSIRQLVKGLLSTEIPSATTTTTTSSVSMKISSTPKINKTRTNVVVSGVAQCRMFLKFLSEKLVLLKKQEGFDHRDQGLDQNFTRALWGYNQQLCITCSNASKFNQDVQLKLQTIMDTFGEILRSTFSKQTDRDLTAFLNFFECMVEEFSAGVSKNRIRERPHGLWKKSRPVVSVVKAHQFQNKAIPAHTLCDICNYRLHERDLVCELCLMSIHKKCVDSVSLSCYLDQNEPNSTKFFGVEIERLVSSDSDLPEKLLKLFQDIESRGITTELIYRKPGASTRLLQLRDMLDKNDVSGVQLESFSPHVVAGAIKVFFREAQQPLIPTNLYDDILRLSDLEETELVQRVCEVAKSFSRVHASVFSCLISHLARVAMHESLNKMSPESLAIIFSPCIFRDSKGITSMESLGDLEKQKSILTCMINNHIDKVNRTLEETMVLDRIEEAATYELKRLYTETRITMSKKNEDDINILKETIARMENEREQLSDRLSQLHPAALVPSTDIISALMDPTDGNSTSCKPDRVTYLRSLLSGSTMSLQLEPSEKTLVEMSRQ